MFTKSVERAVRLATLVAVVAAAPMVAVAAEGGTGSSGGTGSTGSSGAETGKGQMPPSPAAMQKMKPSEMSTMMDKDKDGYVTKDEFLKFQERVFESWDKNKAGRISSAMFADQG